MWQQGQSEMPRAMSGRFLLLVWWTFVVVILATYSGNLIAFLTVTKVTLPISTLGDLPAQDDLKFGTVFGSALWNLLEISSTGAPRRVWEAMDKTDQPNTYGAGKDRVLKGDFALICERSFYEDEAANNCDLTKVPKQEFFFGSYGIGVQKGSPLKDMISEQILLMSESGLLNKLSNDWIPRQECAGLTYTSSKPASLEDAQGAFIVLGFGLGFGIIAMIAEIIHFHCIKDKIKGKKFGPFVFGSETSVRSNKVAPFTDN
ncbi:glutamate receptor 3-like [Lineus longissimus]|uniref:glutamate receptor 3-like n=1 Tax=Lineus longissimus TaxID=88925 RepID=UPI00315D82E0